MGIRWDGVTVAPLYDTVLERLVGQAGEVAVVAVDMPIGLEHTDRRACDDQVRPLLGPRRASLFPAPAREVLGHDTYAAANAWSKLATGRGLSKQAWMLVPKIREVRALVAHAGVAVHETFPELSFLAMAGSPLTHPKRTWTGMATRLDLLRAAGIELPTDAGPAGGAAVDDIIDAAALAWSAARILHGTAECRPADAEGAAPDERPSIWW